MQPILILLLAVVIIASAYGYMVYRNGSEKRAREKRRNQFNDRV